MAFVLWMTGLSCSGKTSIIRKLTEIIPNLAVLEGNELREWLSPIGGIFYKDAGLGIFSIISER